MKSRQAHPLSLAISEQNNYQSEWVIRGGCVPFSPLWQRARGGESEQRCNSVFQMEEKQITLQRKNWSLVLVTLWSHQLTNASQCGHLFSALQLVPSFLLFLEGGGGGEGCLKDVVLFRSQCAVGQCVVLQYFQTGRQSACKTLWGQSLEVCVEWFQSCDSILWLKRRGLPQSCLGGKYQQQWWASKSCFLQGWESGKE